MLLAVIASILSTAIFLPTPASATQASQRECPLYFIGARGSGEKVADTSGETEGMGKTVARVFTLWKASLPEGVNPVPAYLEYKAAGAELLRPTSSQIAGMLTPTLPLIGRTPANLRAYTGYAKNVSEWSASADEGRRFMKQRIEELYSECATSRFVLAGYSQGAMVVHQALSDLQDTPAFESIIGVFLVADGDRFYTAANRFGTARSDSTGVRAAVGRAVETLKPRPAGVVRANIVADICDRNDIVCDWNALAAATRRGEKVHTAYRENNRAIPDAVNGMAAQINSALSLPVLRLDAAFPPATMNDPYSVKLRAYGGDNRYKYRVTGLPPGIEQRGDTVAGKPIRFGTWTVSVTVTDGSGQHDEVNATLNVGLKK